MVRRTALVLALMAWSVADAHDHWINHAGLTDPVSGQWCCNQFDCTPVPAGGIRSTATGYLVVETGEEIPSTRLLPSQDGTFWRCRNRQSNTTRCLIGPPPGS